MTAISVQQLSDFKTLHEGIAIGNLMCIENFISNYPREKFAFFHNESAVKKALKSDQFDVYDFLIAHKFQLAPNEKFDEILKQLDASQTSKNIEKKRKRLREIHKKNIKKCNKSV